MWPVGTFSCIHSSPLGQLEGEEVCAAFYLWFFPPFSPSLLAYIFLASTPSDVRVTRMSPSSVGFLSTFSKFIFFQFAYKKTGIQTLLVSGGNLVISLLREQQGVSGGWKNGGHWHWKDNAHTILSI